MATPSRAKRKKQHIVEDDRAGMTLPEWLIERVTLYVHTGRVLVIVGGYASAEAAGDPGVDPITKRAFDLRLDDKSAIHSATDTLCETLWSQISQPDTLDTDGHKGEFAPKD